MSVRRIRNTDQLKSQSSRRNPTRVSCSTNPCIWRPLRARPGQVAPTTRPVQCLPRSSLRRTSATSRYLDSQQCEWEADSLYSCCDRPWPSVDADDDLGVPESYHVAVGQLPLLHRRVVHGGAVGGVEVGQQGDLAVPPDFQVSTGDAGVGQPELSGLTASDHVGALAQLVGPAAAVVELKGDVGAACGIVALPVAAIAAGRGGRRLAVVISSGSGVAVAGVGVSARSRRFAVAAVVGLPVLLAAVLLAAAVAGVLIGATLVGVAAALLGVTALVGIPGRRTTVVIRSRWGRGRGGRWTAVVAPVIAAWRCWRRVTTRSLPVAALVEVAATRRGAVTGGRTLLVLLRRRVAALVGVAATLLGIAALLGVATAALVGVARSLAVAGIALLGRVTPLVRRRWVLAAGVLAAVPLLGARVAVVVVVVGPPLSLASAVVRVVGHRLYSWFCGVRAVWLCWGGPANGGVGVDDTTSAKLSGV